MPSRLYPESKRALLEQALRVQTHSDLFVKLLIVNRSFINVGRFYKITQLVIDIPFSSYVTISFGVDKKNRTKSFEFSAEQTCQLIDFLQIKMLKICSFYGYGRRFSEYWSLIECFEGKVDFSDDDYPEDTVELVNRFWPKITSLRGPSMLLFSNPRQPSKRFDKLRVSEVYSISDLKKVLRHEADELEIKYTGDLSMHDVNKFFETTPKTNIKRCKLFRRTWFDGIDAIVPFVQCIVGVSPECQKIEISIDIDSIYIAYNLIDQISSAYEIFTDAKNLLLAYPFKLDLFMVSSHSTTFLYENTRDGWLDWIKQKKPEFSNGVYEIKDDRRRTSDKLVVHSVDKAFTSTFIVVVDYRNRY